jgi:hypothetical protein
MIAAYLRTCNFVQPCSCSNAEKAIGNSELGAIGTCITNMLYEILNEVLSEHAILFNLAIL